MGNSDHMMRLNWLHGALESFIQYVSGISGTRIHLHIHFTPTFFKLADFQALIKDVEGIL